MSNITTLDNVKDFMGLVGSKALDDNLIEDIITRITKQFENYCGVEQFQSKTYTEKHNGEGSKYLFLNANLPIVSVTTIHDDTNWEWPDSSLVESGEYLVVDSKYIFCESVFSDYEQALKVVFEAGYESLPEDLIQACIEEVARKYKHRKDFDVISQSIEGSSVSYSEPGLMGSTKQVLKYYKNVWMA